MHQPESIEAILGRLMPPAFSEEGQLSLDAMLDDLCGEEVAEIPQKKHPWKWVISGGIAAAAAIALALPTGSKEIHSTSRALAMVPISFKSTPSMVTIGESERVENSTDEGWLADSQGGAMQAVRVRVIEENTLRDEETGIVVQVSEHRDEQLLFPVNAF